ncbi:MAG TPA: serine/threonine-protein kinase [Pyrinomonadaceae bacterium]|nr:serine/threonine-protein kinase [Pyrinomonadaceae bacterium]HMP66115.1 serine/threonine-protein kinase [Pyrinomonadaceae bacterium]
MKVIRVIDNGGFGRVEEVELDDGNRVARKVFDPTTEVLAASDTNKLKERFQREVKVQKSLSSDFFVPILDFDLSGDPMWFTMPLCEQNFKEEITNARATNQIPKDALADILNALEELHSLDYKHRDLKPQNVLFHNGKWKLSDFGLVLPPDSGGNALTSTLSAWGTEAYCAPEQKQDFKRVTPQADIYSFGCILHDIVDGKPRISYGQHSTNGALGVVIEKCTNVRPDRRFKDISRVRNALFTTLATPVVITPSVETEEWSDLLKSTESWDLSRLHDFVQFVKDPANRGDFWTLFKPLEEEAFVHFAKIDLEYAETLAIEYCDWVKAAGFDYEFCDILVNRLESVLGFQAFDVKVAAIMAIARLGKSHNRWYVMRRLLRICGSNMEERLAQRIAIEIQVEDYYWDFIDSATRSGNTIQDYHHLITEVLDERINRYIS